MSERLRLPLLARAGTEPEPSSDAPLAVSERTVLALVGDEAVVLAFADALVRSFASAGTSNACVLPASAESARRTLQLAGAGALHTLSDRAALAAWLLTLDPRAAVLCVGAAAAHALAPTFVVALGRERREHRERNARGPSADLWLGHAHERVARALAAVLQEP